MKTERTGVAEVSRARRFGEEGSPSQSLLSCHSRSLGLWGAFDTPGDVKIELVALDPDPLPFSTHSKFVIEPVSEERIWKFSEIGLAQGGDAVDVLEVNVPPKVWLPLCLKLLPGRCRVVRSER